MDPHPTPLFLKCVLRGLAVYSPKGRFQVDNQGPWYKYVNFEEYQLEISPPI